MRIVVVFYKERSLGTFPTHNINKSGIVKVLSIQYRITNINIVELTITSTREEKVFE